ncbi:MAG: GNAT family N-acetyltransferase [Acidimicrobiales bacterium]
MDHASSPALGSGLPRPWSASLGGSRLRVVPWQGDRHTALVGPARASRPPTSHDLAACLDRLEARGVRAAVTPALSPADARPFEAAGFGLRERLHLLSFDLSLDIPEPRHALVAGRPWHRRSVLRIDRAAFEDFWQFDTASLSEARRATPAHRYRVAVESRRPVGYAVTGRAGHRGYLQRLAVDPARFGEGIGSSLVHDCLLWLRRRRAAVAMVNTQERNERALDLYRRLGFESEPMGLVVLEWSTS